MSQDLQVVQSRLEAFRKNIEKLQYQIAAQEPLDSLNKTKGECKTDADILVLKFKQGKFQRDENMKIQMLSKEFQKQFKMYTDTLEQLKYQIQQEQQNLEHEYETATERRQTQMQDIRKNRRDEGLDDDEQSEETAYAELQEMEGHPDVGHNLMLIQEKNEEIAEIQQEVEETYKIMGDVAKLVFDQGKQLDVAENNINQSNQNVKVAVLELEGAQVEHKSYVKKMAGGIFCVILVVAIILLVVL